MESGLRQPRYALCTWQKRPMAPQGQWAMHLGFEEGDLLTLCVVWDQPKMPSLMERYDALAYLGYAVEEGGPEAWEWQEGALEDGSPGLLGRALIRPLTAEESEAVGSQGTDPTTGQRRCA